ncbi:MAG: xanthine dehydrogenase family protein molybdopterin-binding subunit [Sulfolobaceae archaeon]|nr:xanthine dehydrogenase family protein molybdopterin-binding subunit [Sulfolobaceae archaeon]
MIQEHLPIITGKSKYIDDIVLPNTVTLYVIRSHVARGIIRSISLPENALLTLKWEDVKLYMPARIFPDMKNVQVKRYPVLADGKVNFVGQPIAAVVVNDRYEGEDVAENASVEIEALEPVVDPEEAINAKPIHDDLKSNIAISQDFDGGDLSLKSEAEVVVRRKLRQNRIISNPIETKGCIAWWDGDTLNLYVGTQAPFRVRDDLREALGVSPEKIRVISAPNVGGAFGNKSGGYPEYVLAAIASLKLHRPVKWIETRSEFLTNANSPGRGEISDLKLYAKRDGTALGIEGTIIVNIGAYTFGAGPMTPLFLARLVNGPYKLRFASINAIGVFTNTAPMGFYRGAGRPEAALMHETLMNDLAEEIGMDPMELRKKNLVDDDGYVTPLGLKYDSAGYSEVFEKAYSIYKEIKQKYKDKGLGIAFFTALISVPPGEAAKIKVENGKVNIYLGIGPHGQGYYTTFRKLASETLGLTEDKIDVYAGSTDYVKEAIGSFGSRGGSTAGSAVILASRELLKSINKDRLSLEDLQKLEGKEIEVFFRGDTIFAPGAHIAIVDVNKETGKVSVIDYYAVDDVGRILNREEIEGQLHGGILQGVMQVLGEAMIYDDNGNPLCGNILECGLSTAVEAPKRINLNIIEHPSKLPSQSRGVGEAGTIGGLASTFLAVENALKKKFNKTPIEPQDIIS